MPLSPRTNRETLVDYDGWFTACRVRGHESLKEGSHLHVREASGSFSFEIVRCSQSLEHKHTTYLPLARTRHNRVLVELPSTVLSTQPSLISPSKIKIDRRRV